MRSNLKFSLTGLLLLVWCLGAQAGSVSQVTEEDSVNVSRGKLVVLPLIFFKPETSWSFGAGSVYTFRLPGQPLESNPQQFQIGGSWSLKNQIAIQGQARFFFRDQYRVYGEVGWYNFSYQFYGIGNNEDKFEEIYFATFPSVEVNMLSKVLPDLFGGFRFILDDFKVTETAENSRLNDGEITGSEGGFHSALGVVINYDTRDRAYCPCHGTFLEVAFYSSNSIFGSSFNYLKTIADYSAYFELKEDHILAFNAYGEFTNGEVPFNQLAQMGGSSRMRGYNEGFYTDKHYLTTQLEYRFPLFWRLGAVAFFSVGRVSDEFLDFDVGNFRITTGGGLRFALDEKEKVNLRLDYGIGKGTSGFYITVGEAF